MDLIYPKEKTLKIVLLVISLIIWASLLLASRGLVLIYVALFALIYLFAQAAFIAYVRGTGVKLSAAQFPDINERLLASAQRLEFKTVPDCYVLRMNVFNSLATKFLGRSYIVLFAEVVDELQNYPDALNFYIGHELGHLKRHHLSWRSVLLPGSFLPLLGAAYRRSCEYTCDRHGLACCATPEAAQRGLLALAVRRSRLAATSIAAYASQIVDTGGFWMSYNELTADYPWLTKRVAAIGALGGTASAGAAPRRHWLAWLFATFTLRIGMIAAGSGMAMIAIIGVLAAIAIPAYQDYTLRAQVAAAVAETSQVKTAVANYFATNGHWPAELAVFGIKHNLNGQYVDSLTIDNGTIRMRFGAKAGLPLVGKELDMRPSVSSTQNVIWVCGYARDSGSDPAGGAAGANATDVPSKFLPLTCRGQ